MRKTRPSDESNVKNVIFLNLLFCSLLHAAAAADGVCFAQLLEVEKSASFSVFKTVEGMLLPKGTWPRCGPNSALAAVHMGGGGGGVKPVSRGFRTYRGVPIPGTPQGRTAISRVLLLLLLMLLLMLLLLLLLLMMMVMILIKNDSKPLNYFVILDV